MRETAKALEKDGHTLVNFNLTKQEALEMKTLYMQNFGMGFYFPFKEEMDKNYEYPAFYYEKGIQLSRLPVFLQKIALSIVGLVHGQRKVNAAK